MVDRTLAFDSAVPTVGRMKVHRTELYGRFMLPSAFLLQDLAISLTSTLAPLSLWQLTMPMGRYLYHRSFHFLYLESFHLEPSNTPRWVSDPDKNAVSSIT